MKYTSLVYALHDKVGSQSAVAKLVGVSQPTVSNWLAGSDIFGENINKLLAAAKTAGLEAGVDRPDSMDVTQVKGVDRRTGEITDASTAFWAIPTAFLRWQMRSNPDSVVVADVDTDAVGFNRGDVLIIDTSDKEPDENGGMYAVFKDGNVTPMGLSASRSGIIGRIKGRVTAV